MTDASAAGPAEARVSDETTELARRYAEALIDAAETEGAVDSLLEELAEIERDVSRRSRDSPSAGVGPGLAAHKDQILTEVFDKSRLEPGPAVPAGLESPRTAGTAGGRGPRGSGHLGSAQQAHPGSGSLGRRARRTPVANTS